MVQYCQTGTRVHVLYIISKTKNEKRLEIQALDTTRLRGTRVHTGVRTRVPRYTCTNITLSQKRLVRTSVRTYTYQYSWLVRNDSPMPYRGSQLWHTVLMAPWYQLVPMVRTRVPMVHVPHGMAYPMAYHNSTMVYVYIHVYVRHVQQYTHTSIRTRVRTYNVTGMSHLSDWKRYCNTRVCPF